MKVSDALALHGGSPVRSRMLPYGRQDVSDADIAAVVEVLRSDWLTTGPVVAEFERACAARGGVRHGVAVSSGTAALHAAMRALDVRAGDEVIVPAMTFAATANCARYEGATPVFADVDRDTLLIDPATVERAITPRTRAVIAVDYAGQPADYDALAAILKPRGISLVADACHSIGGASNGRPVGTLARLSCFSFHPVKHVTTGEGGAVVTDEAPLAERMRVFRNHGIVSDHRQREAQGAFAYDMVELGYNYRITDIQCALGLQQLERLPTFIARRRQIAARYDAAFAQVPAVRPLAVRRGAEHAYHLYVVRLDLEALRAGRSEIFRALRAENIGVNVHYVPVHLHPYYRQTQGTHPGMCPVAESAYEGLLSLPMFPAMSDADVDDVIEAVEKVVVFYRR
jgi:perosamine synthetase